MYNRDKLFIDGTWSAPQSGASLDVISPHSEKPIGTVALAGVVDVDRAVRAARTAFDDGPWPGMQPIERIEALNRLAELYKENRSAMAELITAEIGAPISFAKRAQVRIPLMMFSAFGDLAAKYDWQENRPGLYGNDIRINKAPVGVVAAVVPWNMPQFLTVGKIVPALLAGCTVVLKPSPEAVLDAQFLADLVQQAGLPPGVFNVVPGDREVG
jgi:aldehyde dehydrogenase (NAD+)